MVIISIENMSMTYHSKIRRGLFKSETREVEALKNINLEIEEETVFGLLGPNGAGKTSLIKCLTTLLIPTQGTAVVNGYDIKQHGKQVRASVGAMLMGERGLYWKLTARENLEYFGQLYSIPKSVRRDRIEEIINLLDLHEFADRPVETYSSGQKMKAAFGKTLINDPPVVFLDEPTIAMDVQGARNLRKIVSELPDRGKTVIYTTHLMHEAEELCDDLAIIDRGEIIARDRPEDLIRQSSIDKSIIVTGIMDKSITDDIENLEYVSKTALHLTEDDEYQLTINVTNSKSVLAEITQELLHRDVKITSIEQQTPNLEDVFVEMTGRSLAEDTKEEEV